MQLELSPMSFSYLLKRMKQLLREMRLVRVQMEVMPVSMLLYVWTLRVILRRYEFLCDMKKI
jgi:hypothetical protein